METLKKRSNIDLTDIAKYGISDVEWEKYMLALSKWVVESAKGTAKYTHFEAIPIVKTINSKVDNYEREHGR